MRDKIIDLLYAENVRSDCGIERLADEICAIDPVKWVPVIEGLPEEGKQVLVCDDFGAELIQNSKIWQQIKDLPAAQPEPLTDKEQRIFLAAMAREEKICEEVDRNYVREPYEDSLMGVCKEIRRKVKDALWT